MDDINKYSEQILSPMMTIWADYVSDLFDSRIQELGIDKGA